MVGLRYPVLFLKRKSPPIDPTVIVVSGPPEGGLLAAFRGAVTGPLRASVRPVRPRFPRSGPIPLPWFRVFQVRWRYSASLWAPCPPGSTPVDAGDAMRPSQTHEPVLSSLGPASVRRGAGFPACPPLRSRRCSRFRGRRPCSSGRAGPGGSAAEKYLGGLDIFGCGETPIHG